MSACPKCGETAAEIWVAKPSRLVRRCSKCRHRRVSGLPNPDKRVVYVDQFALSEILKARGGRKSRTLDPFWLDLYDRFLRLLLLQQAVFPDSNIHLDESVTSPFSRPLVICTGRSLEAFLLKTRGSSSGGRYLHLPDRGLRMVAHRSWSVTLIAFFAVDATLGLTRSGSCQIPTTRNSLPISGPIATEQLTRWRRFSTSGQLKSFRLLIL